jgi:hypothetical protein
MFRADKLAQQMTTEQYNIINSDLDSVAFSQQIQTGAFAYGAINSPSAYASASVCS